jgi:hypothetical protein
MIKRSVQIQILADRRRSCWSHRQVQRNSSGEFRTAPHINFFQDRFHYERSAGKSHIQNPGIQSSPSLPVPSLVSTATLLQCKNDATWPALLCLRPFNSQGYHKMALRPYTTQLVSNNTQNYWFRTSAVFWMLYAFFWVIPRRLNFICRRFGTHCSIFIGW